METLKFLRTLSESDRITSLEIGGNLVLENSHSLAKELVDASRLLSNQVEITINNPEEIDLSCIQLLVAFIRQMDKMKVAYRFNWNIGEDQRNFLVNIGLSKELFMNNLYV